MKSIKTTSMALVLMFLMSPMCSLTAMDDSVNSVRKAQEYADYVKEHKGEEDNVAKTFYDYFNPSKKSTASVATEVKTTWFGNIRDWSKDKAAAGYDSVKDGFNSGITTIQENPKTSVAVGLGIAALIGVSYVIYKKLTEKTDETDDK